jgi:hypothetical protein
MPKQQKAKIERRFLAMWDCNGLESLFDITDSDHDAMMAGLKGETFRTPYNISMMIMRARFNTQRSYEIYAFTTEEDIDYDTVLEMFKHSPQVIVNAIRKNGHKIHSDYHPSQKVIA